MPGKTISSSCRTGTRLNYLSRRVQMLIARSPPSWPWITKANCGMCSEYFGHSLTSTIFMRILPNPERLKRPSLRCDLPVNLLETRCPTVLKFHYGLTTAVKAWASGKIRKINLGLSLSLWLKYPDVCRAWGILKPTWLQQPSSSILKMQRS